MTNCPRSSRVAALDRDAALRFIGQIPRFRENLFAGFGRRLSSVVAGERCRRIPKIVGVVSCGPTSRELVPLLARRLQQSGKRIHVFTDRADDSLVDVQTSSLAIEPNLRREIRKRLSNHDRLLIDLTLCSRDAIQRVGEECDEVLWCCHNDKPDRESEALLGEMVDANPLLKSRIICVQLTSADRPVGRRGPCCPALAQRDFLLPIGGPLAELERLQPPALDRVVRHLRGVKIGIALGGGGARGLSHLGVLKALDRAGISFDTMSGTSAGAMIGLGYAAGKSPEFLIDAFTRALTPPELFEKIPGGRRLYLFTKFLQQAWKEMLRDYYGDGRFEQLPIPFAVVATDLVAGVELVRDSGDIVHAILESINVPVMSEPILKDGKVLVDGGVLNNLPIELLTDQGAGFVVGVDASKEIPNHFAGNSSQMQTDEMKTPGRLETAYRVMEVSRRGIAQLQMSMADVVIEPDTSAFDFADIKNDLGLYLPSWQVNLPSVTAIASPRGPSAQIDRLHAIDLETLGQRDGQRARLPRVLPYAQQCAVAVGVGAKGGKQHAGPRQTHAAGAHWQHARGAIRTDRPTAARACWPPAWSNAAGCRIDRSPTNARGPSDRRSRTSENSCSTCC